MKCGAECLEDVVGVVKRKKLKIGTIVVVQTHGRSGRYNPHLHIIMTSGGISTEEDRWHDLGYFKYEMIHKKWQYCLFNWLKAYFESSEINQLLNVLWKKYPKGLVANVSKGSVPESCRGLAGYLAKYVASPPIAVRRIVNDDGQTVFNDDDYQSYLELMSEWCMKFGVETWAYCLMPNHFHIMMKVNSVELDVETFSQGVFFTRGATCSRAPSKKCAPKSTNLNKEIGILLASYTRAINKQNDWSGSLFRQKTKAECLTQPKGITPSFYNTNQGTKIHLPKFETEYPQNCFNYIHQNPVKAGIVNNSREWEFSSYLEYFGNKKEILVNKIAARDSGIIF
jgi:putative transposase